MTGEESLPRQTQPRSFRAVHKLTIPDPLYDLRLRRELEVANARTRIELGASGGCVVEEPRRKPCVEDPMHMEKLTGREVDGEKMRNYQNLAMAAALCVASGCASDGHESPKRDHGASRQVVDGPRIDRRYVPPIIKNGKLIMPFFDHSFSASCYDTLACRVLYENAYVVNEEDPSGPLTPVIRKNLRGGWGSLDFPSKAHVVWTSKDGEEHEEEIDLEEIFKSKLVLYSPELDVRDVNLHAYYRTPDIILVIENRSIYVYIKTLIPLIKPVDPRNIHSNGRIDMVMAYTKTL
jgi:hypothetical protein